MLGPINQLSVFQLVRSRSFDLLGGLLQPVHVGLRAKPAGNRSQNTSINVICGRKERNGRLCGRRRAGLPFDGGVVLVYEVSGQWEKLLFGSDLVWFADVLVGHHHRADAHIFRADWQLERQKKRGVLGDSFAFLVFLHCN